MNFNAPYMNPSTPSPIMDQILLSLQRLEVTVVQNFHQTNEKIKVLENRMSGMQMFLMGLEKQRSTEYPNMMSQYMCTTNAFTQVLQTVFQQMNQHSGIGAMQQQFMHNAINSQQHPGAYQQFAQLPLAVAPTVPRPAPAVEAPKQTPVKIEEVKKQEAPKAGSGDKFVKKEGEVNAAKSSFSFGIKPATAPVNAAKSSFSFVTVTPTPPVTTPSAPVAKQVDAPKPNAPLFSKAPEIKKESTTVSGVAASPLKTATSPFSFNAPSPFAAKTAGSSLSDAANKSTDNKSSFGGGMNNTSMLFGGSSPFSQGGGASFASMAAKPDIFANKSNASFGATSSNTFKAADDTAGNGEEDSPEDFVPDAHYEPVIPLPEIIQVKTGEEGEDILLETVCKLYAFVDKQIKERGQGVMRVLFHPEKKKCRIVMRREQVHKICANFPLTSGMSLTDKPNRDNMGLVNTIDFSENAEGERFVFLFKFDNGATYQEFKNIFNDCVSGRDFSKAVSKPAATLSKTEVASPRLPDLSVEEADDEDEEYNDDEGEDEEEDYAEHQVIHEVICSLKATDEDGSNVESYDNIQMVITTTDDQYFKVWFDVKKNGEEFCPHWIDQQADFTYNAKRKQINYAAVVEDTGEKKNLVIKFLTEADAKKTFDLLETFKEDYVYLQD